MNYGRQTIAFVLATALAAQAGVKIVEIDPPEKDFFSKRLDFHGIPVKAHKVVAN